MLGLNLLQKKKKKKFKCTSRIIGTHLKKNVQINQSTQAPLNHQQQTSLKASPIQLCILQWTIRCFPFMFSLFVTKHDVYNQKVF